MPSTPLPFDALASGPAGAPSWLFQLLEATNQGFWLIDNALRTLDVNPAMCRMLGTTREAMLGRSIFDYVDEANAEIFRSQVRARTAGAASSYQIALLRADGGLVDCFNNATPVRDAAGHKIGAVGLFSDISAQTAAERQARLAELLLRQKSKVLESTLESLSQGVLSFDAGTRINAFNHRALELLDLPRSLLQAHPTLREVTEHQVASGHLGPGATVVGTPGHEELRRWMEQAESSQARWRYERTTHRGRIIEVDCYRADDGSSVRTFTDVTERRAAEQALSEARDAAERASRAKSDFLSRMSHELRTPMNAILGFAQLLMADADHPLQPNQASSVREMLQGGRHLLALIDEVLDLARIEAGAMRVLADSVAVAPVLRECLELVRATADARGIVLLPPVFDNPEPLVRADAVRLKQVLLNLLSNAVKYNREHGSVHLRCASQGDGLLIEVRDEGAGLTAEQQALLFRAFERLQAQDAEGVGIGLALSKQLVELMGGQMGVQSRPGEGSTFWLRLPRDDRPPPLPAPDDESAAPSAARGRRTVLYIEDNPVNQLLMRGMLAHRSEIDLLQADTPHEGLALAAMHRPHLVLLDIQLPGMDGFEVLRRLRADARTAAIPVVAVSANAMASDVSAARDAGFDDYWTKPLDLGQLLRSVDATLKPQNLS
ncbi:MAG: PAS-domain containing protein [Burkholderiales bacterium]|nr:PAS-domain containing protein [Burkholderiales bacterium]